MEAAALFLRHELKVLFLFSLPAKGKQQFLQQSPCCFSGSLFYIVLKKKKKNQHFILF